MNTTAVAIVIVLIVSAGLYVGVTNLNQLYSIDTSGSSAGEYACAADVRVAKPSIQVTFRASAPEGAIYYWSAPDATTASFVTGGPLVARYARVGTKTASLFYTLNNRWYRTTCSVQIQ